MKKLLLFGGCMVPVLLPTYEAATIHLLKRFNIKVIPLKNANCCGTQYTEALNSKAHLALSGRILALAESKGLDLLTLCGACMKSLRYASNVLAKDVLARMELNSLLEDEGIRYNGTIRVKHLLEVIKEDIGLTSLKHAITEPYRGARFAAHNGCQVVAHNGYLNLSESETLSLLDDIIKLAGGLPVDYPGKYECCGGPFSAIDTSLSERVAKDKIAHINAAGAKGIVTVCAYCSIHLTQAQSSMKTSKNRIPLLSLPQFLASALGLRENDLGVQANGIGVRGTMDSLSITRD